jgi:peptidoglycan/xylan/chitin deacetylase (PgdA/CDA1 family)
MPNGNCFLVDDNYKTWHDAADLFERLGIKVTFYLNTLPIRDIASQCEIEAYYDTIDHHENRISLSSEEIRFLSKAGHCIGSHTHSHKSLSSIPSNEAAAEIQRGKEILEEVIGSPIVHFSYPFGMRRFLKTGYTPANLLI